MNEYARRDLARPGVIFALIAIDPHLHHLNMYVCKEYVCV